jgi:hypothetical protein
MTDLGLEGADLLLGGRRGGVFEQGMDLVRRHGVRLPW